MFETIYVFLLSVYAVVSVKIDEWITIPALGFRSETPEMFLRKARIYDIFRSTLFITALFLSFFITVIPWYISIGIIYLVWLLAGKIGRKKAFKNYRKVLYEMIEGTESQIEKAELEEASKKSDQELMDQVQMMIKHGI